MESTSIIPELFDESVESTLRFIDLDLRPKMGVVVVCLIPFMVLGLAWVANWYSSSSSKVSWEISMEAVARYLRNKRRLLEDFRVIMKSEGAGKQAIEEE